jgi:hypothetical protein
MTTSVRIEKADCNGSVKVRVRRQYRVYKGAPDEYIRTDEWADSTDLDPIILYCNDLTSRLTLHDDVRYVIDEIK